MTAFTSYNGPDPIVYAMMFRITDNTPADYLCDLATKHGVSILSINPTGVIIGYHKNTESEQHAIAIKNAVLARYGHNCGECDNRPFLRKIFDKFKLRG